MTETSEASYYVTGPRYGRVLLALAVPCAVAVLGVGVACGLLRFSTTTALGFALILVVAAVVLASGLTLIVAGVRGDRPDAPRVREARRPQRRVLARPPRAQARA
jgi:hypothetical protein